MTLAQQLALEQSKFKLFRKRAREQHTQDQETIQRLEALLMTATQANSALREKATARFAAMRKQMEEKDLELSRALDDSRMLSTSVPNTPHGTPGPSNVPAPERTPGPSAVRVLPFSQPSERDRARAASYSQAPSSTSTAPTPALTLASAATLRSSTANSTASNGPSQASTLEKSLVSAPPVSAPTTAAAEPLATAVSAASQGDSPGADDAGRRKGPPPAVKPRSKSITE
jgi:hypothetical protein